MSRKSWPFELRRSGRDAISLARDSFDESIFREYDIRGRVQPTYPDPAFPLNEFMAKRLGCAFGTYLRRRDIGRVVVGYDARSYSELLHNAVVLGLLSTGAEVVSIGLATTPLVYFAQHELGGLAGVSITASHNPNGWSGLKLSDQPSVTLGPDGIGEVAGIAARSEFATGAGSYREESLTERYAGYLAAACPAPRPLTVVADGGNSVSGPIAELALRQAGYQVVPLNGELDWTFPNHEPDPESVEARRQIRDAVLTHGADAGLSFDGDGDRLGVTDDRGDVVWADPVLALLAEDVLSRAPGAPIVFDVKCSRLVAECVTRSGGTPVMWKTGHSHIKEKMRELKAPFAGERSGHFFFSEGYLGYDDAIFAALRFLRVVAGSGRSVSGLVGALPQYKGTPTMHAECPDEDKYRVVDDFARYAETIGAREIVRINGVRAEFDDGWLLVRASSNLPSLVILAEATSVPRLRDLYGTLREGLARSPEVASEWSNDPYA